MRTPEALAVFGPRAFGLRHTYLPLGGVPGMSIALKLCEARRSGVRAVIPPQADRADAAPVATARLRPPRGLITRIDRPFVDDPVP